VAIALALTGLAACQARGVAPGAGASDARRGPAESAYRAPPAVALATPRPDGRILLVGRAAPGARVRLSTPAGAAAFADAGSDGLWRLVLAPSPTPRLFGLAMIDHGLPVQSEGYVALSPRGGVALLRAGAGAVVMGAPSAGPDLAAVDFDSKGQAVVSGRASPRAHVEAWVDGARAAQGVAAADGRVSLALNAPLAFGARRISLIDGPRRADVEAVLDAAKPPAPGPYRAALTPRGWRIDWLTPGGGLQTTLLLGRDF
jgi:hypothetical protein